MPRLREINNRVSSDLISMQLYKGIPDFRQFDPDMKFEKWAAAEVSNHNVIPDGMEAFTLKGGLYAVFHYTGYVKDAASVFRFIFAEWLPGSEYRLDDRPHFELLGVRYDNERSDSEEDIWIPVKNKE
jgi:AraC family transcriptional regulator